jgi:hypothetical protein
MADDQSVAGWMTMDIKMNKATRRVSEEGIWTAASLASVPIPEFFNCCSLSPNDIKVEGKYTIETPDRRKDRPYTIETPDRRKDRPKYEIRKPGTTLLSQKGHANEYQQHGEANRVPTAQQSASAGIKTEPRIKTVGKCLSAADAKKLLQEMGVEEDAQVEFNGFGGQQNNLSKTQSPQNPRVLVRYTMSHRLPSQSIIF